jgi:hypothetical protein
MSDLSTNTTHKITDTGRLIQGYKDLGKGKYKIEWLIFQRTRGQFTWETFKTFNTKAERDICLEHLQSQASTQKYRLKH